MARYFQIFSFAALASLLLSPSAAADGLNRSEKSLAAGYKSMFTCSAMFNGGKTAEQIQEDELSNIYSDYKPAMAAIAEAVVNRTEKYVSVKFADDMPPRISAWRPHLGCSALPPGATSKDIKNLPRVKFKTLRVNADDIMWPMGDKLPNSSPIDSSAAEAINTAVDAAFAGDFGGNSSAVLIVKNGQIIAERYKPGFDKHTSQRTWSVAKSVGASVMGAAVEKGYIDIKDPAGLEAWSAAGDPRAAITTENLLHMASGLNSEPAGNRTDQVYFGGGKMAQHATKAPLEAPPGSRWRYANNDTMLALRALREEMDNDRRYHSFPFKALLHKIGMYHTVPEMDWGGDFIFSSQVWTTSRDLARLGLLYLNDGVWEGERLLPEGWSGYVSAPLGAQPPNRLGKKAEEPGRGYGAQFWRYENYNNVPAGTYAALGNRGQFLIIVPDLDLLIIRRGYDWRGNYFDGPKFTGAVASIFE